MALRVSIQYGRIAIFAVQCILIGAAQGGSYSKSGEADPGGLRACPQESN